MLTLDKRKSVDLLIDQFWKQGYLTLSRKFGTYLPEPSKMGGFDVDVVARQKKNYAIGIALTDDDFRDPKLIEKLAFLANRHTKFSKKKVLLFVGVPEERLRTAKQLVEEISSDIRKNIKLLPIIDKPVEVRHTPKTNYFS